MPALLSTVNQLLARVRRLEAQVSALENTGPGSPAYLIPGGGGYYLVPGGGYYLRP